jgi:chromosome segregation ATPase
MARVVTDLQGQFETVEFEHVEAAPDTALLRVAARPSQAADTGPLTLLITDGDNHYRHEQLPALPAPAGLIRAAFSAPLSQLVAGASYSLELADGELVPLPAPSRRRPAIVTPAATGAAATPVASEPPAEENEASRLVEAERRAESHRLAISELERRLASERERRSAAESDMAFLRAERDEARAERDAAIADREEAIADRDQAEARARAAAASAGTLEAQLRTGSDSATRELANLEAQLADRVAEIERIRTAAEVAQARAYASRQELTALDEQLAHAQAQISVMQQALEERESERASATAALDRAAALRLHNAELESTLAELDAALAMRAAEIEVLRVAVAERGTTAPVEPAVAANLADALAQANLRADEAQAALEARTGELARLQEALRVESEKRGRAEEALVEAAAQHALRSESLALEANRLDS